MSEDFLWVEKYRPKKVEECILPDSLIDTFREFLLEGDMPNLLLSGTAGTGKTTVAKAKEVQPFVERLITIARRTLIHERASEEFQSGPNEGPDKSSSEWQQWAAARAPVVAAKRRVHALLGGGDPDSKKAVDVLFSTLAPRFEFRAGGYTRVLHSAQRRLGDGGATAILEFVGDDEVSMVRPETTSAVSDPESDTEVETDIEEDDERGQEADPGPGGEIGKETEDDKD
mgnify:CR=1 FL=1